MNNLERVARAVCAETCAFMGEPPCYTVEGEWPNPNCSEPGCSAIARAAIAALEPVGVQEAARLQKLLESILPHIKRAQEDFWDWQDEGPYGEGWRSKENVECYEAIYDWIVEARQALKGKEMSDDLVNRLREPCFERGLDELWIDAQRKEAADRIEELEAKLEKLEAEEFTVGTLTMKHVFRPSGLTNVSDMQAVFDATERGFEELEAKLAKAVEALTLYIYETTHLSAEEDDGSHWCKISKDCLAQGRTTLAEMKGDKDE